MADKHPQLASDPMPDHYNQQRLEALETKIAFLEDSIEQLNQVMVSQQQQLSSQKESIRLLANKLKSTQTSQLADEADETPPPHY